MKQKGQFLLLGNPTDFRKWLQDQSIKRRVTVIQQHHTWKPDYSNFNGKNHFDLLEGMDKYHEEKAGFSDIAQHITTFPDGAIAVCRDLEKDPAGIKGANKGAICIENVGNFDIDTMTIFQKETIIAVTAALCEKFKLVPSTFSIVYHNWYDLNTGERLQGKGTTKTCPGVNFFGGNTPHAALTNFIPLVKAKIADSTVQKADKPITYNVDGKPVKIESVNHGGKEYVRVTDLVKAMGGTIEWSGKDRTNYIRSKK